LRDFLAPVWHCPTQQKQTQKTKDMQRTIRSIALGAAVLLTLGLSSINAKATPSRGGVELITASFHKDFRHAELLATETAKNYTKFTFKLNGTILFAFYSGNGDLLAITHNITSSQLPLELFLQLKRDYDSYWITDLFELNANNNTNYYITLENANSRLTLRSSQGAWETYRKTNKQ
jgi:hypothetical protein